jgi:hypothetical protein
MLTKGGLKGVDITDSDPADVQGMDPICNVDEIFCAGRAPAKARARIERIEEFLA